MWKWGTALDDFDVGDPEGLGVLAELGEAGGDETAESDGEAVPQLGGVPGEQHVADVVVAVGTDRLAHRFVPDVVDGPAAGGPCMGAVLVGPDRMAGLC